jgi:hypothetical protein
MARTRIVVDLSTGQQTEVAYTSEEEAEADAAYEAEQMTKSTATAEQNGAALDERQKQTAKEDARALLNAGKTNDAVLKLMELL